MKEPDKHNARRISVSYMLFLEGFLDAVQYTDTHEGLRIIVSYMYLTNIGFAHMNDIYISLLQHLGSKGY